MTNRGVYSGVKRGGWQDFAPEIRSFAQSGTPVSPVLGNAQTYARWLRRPSGLIVYQGGITFGSTTTFGSSTQVWGVNLPYPANRSSGGADLPIGTAWCWKGASANPSTNVNLVPTLMDPLVAGGGSGSNEDNYMQFFLPYLIDQGTATILSGTTSVVVAHNLSSWTATASDIQLTPTATTSNNPGILFADTFTATGFTVNCKANPGASNLAFAWKLRGEPNQSSAFDLLVNQNRPYVHASGHLLAWQVAYEGRR